MRDVVLDESLQAKTEQLTAVTDAMAGFVVIYCRDLVTTGVPE